MPASASALMGGAALSFAGAGDVAELVSAAAAFVASASARAASSDDCAGAAGA
jgi:hypothetical protein